MTSPTILPRVKPGCSLSGASNIMALSVLALAAAVAITYLYAAGGVRGWVLLKRKKPGLNDQKEGTLARSLKSGRHAPRADVTPTTFRPHPSITRRLEVTHYSFMLFLRSALQTQKRMLGLHPMTSGDRSRQRFFHLTPMPDQESLEFSPWRSTSVPWVNSNTMELPQGRKHLLLFFCCLHKLLLELQRLSLTASPRNANLDAHKGET